LTDDNIPNLDNIPPLDGAQQAALALLGKGEGGAMNHRLGRAGANRAAVKK
jgi:hypothetical protein